MQEIDVPAGRLVEVLLSAGGKVCLLDSCGVGKPGSNLLIAGVDPVRTVLLSDDDPQKTLEHLDSLLAFDDLAAVFSISYDFGLKLNGITPANDENAGEPDMFVALFDSLVIHDYESGKTWLGGSDKGIESFFKNAALSERDSRVQSAAAKYTSNFSKKEYLDAVGEIQELIRRGETYQTNLTQRLTVRLPAGSAAKDVFLDLRLDHPAPYAAYLDRGESVVVSASPEQFVRVEKAANGRQISASPIKGTRPRGVTPEQDVRMRYELLASPKDRAENTMIVDLMRNDLGRVCEFGSIVVEDLCRVEEHPTLFHLVSTVAGTLRENIFHSDIIRAVFPCGSITGAPKIRTMEIINYLETAKRGLSMGAIGCRIPGGRFGVDEMFEMSVAIRTMTIREREAVFNVGGGIVIDSDPESEYDEAMLKAKALLRALGSTEATVPGEVAA